MSFHCFPTDKKRRKEREDACGRTQLHTDPRLCSPHCSPDALEAFSRAQLLKELAGYKRRLKPNASPPIVPHQEPERPRGASDMLVKKRQRAETLDALPSRQPAPAVAASVT